MAFAAAYRRVAMVCVTEDGVLYFKIKCVTGRNKTEAAARYARREINRWKPDVVITERTDRAVQKSAQTKAVTAAIADVASASPVNDVVICRQHEFENKHEEAVHLVGRYPQLAGRLPKPRRFFDPEPRATVLFEALSLIESIKRNPAERLAAAMG